MLNLNSSGHISNSFSSNRQQLASGNNYSDQYYNSQFQTIVGQVKSQRITETLDQSSRQQNLTQNNDFSVFNTNSENECDDGNTPFNVDAIWKREFTNIFKSEFAPDLWGLEKFGDSCSFPEKIMPTSGFTNWLTYEESAKVRYCCNRCGNGWTSMKGKVVFFYHLFTDWTDLKLHGEAKEQEPPKCPLKSS